MKILTPMAAMWLGRVCAYVLPEFLRQRCSRRNGSALVLVSVLSAVSIPTTAFAFLSVGQLTIVSHERHEDDAREYVVDLPVINMAGVEALGVSAQVTSNNPDIRVERRKLHVGDIAAGATRHVRFEISVRRHCSDDDRASKDHVSTKDPSSSSRDSKERGDCEPPPPPDLSVLGFVFDQRVGHQVTFTATSISENLHAVGSLLPKSSTSGNPVLIQTDQGAFEFDPTVKNPTTAAAACLQSITSCMSPQRSIDDCTLSVPACKTQTPWMEDVMCCPAACYIRYRSARQAGMNDLAAMLETYIDDGSCIPQFKGLRAIQNGIPTAHSCSTYTINKATGIPVDDDLQILLNGTLIFNDNDHVATVLPAVTFNGCSGDSLRFVATNWFLPCAGISPLDLTRNSDGANRALDPSGFSGGCNSSVPGNGFVFYDKTFQIPF